MDQLRLLIDPPAAGAWNMAVDDVLLESAAVEGFATLRFYEWEVPTLSLGYFQAAHDRHEHAASCDCPLVRRTSGGGAIVHDRELTYSIALPQAQSRLSAAAALYDSFHQSLVQTLAAFGVAAAQFRPAGGPCAVESPASARAEPFLCFQRRSCGDIVSGNAKIAGSAQRRRKGAVLQHGSILLARSSASPELPGIREICDVSISPKELMAHWLPLLEARLCRRARRGELTAAEREQARQFAAQRFAVVEYTHRR